MEKLLLSNKGPIHRDEVRLVGLTVNDRTDRTIGQFASGKAFALALFGRTLVNHIEEGEPITTFLSGTTKMDIFAEPRTVQGKEFRELTFSENGRKPIPLGLTNQFGVINWPTVDMGCRELTSNALDRVEGDPTQVVIRRGTKVCHPTRDTDWTTVALPLTAEVQKFFDNLDSYYLHWRPEVENPYESCLVPKQRRGHAQVFCDGVLVREYERIDANSLYDYNIPKKDLHLDEARKASDYAVLWRMCRMLAEAKVEELIPVFRQFKLPEDKRAAEAFFDDSGLELYFGQNKETWKAAWNEAMGEKALPCDIVGASVGFMQALHRKGYSLVMVPEHYRKALQVAGVPQPWDVIRATREGRVLRELTEHEAVLAHNAWDKMKATGLFPEMEEMTFPNAYVFEATSPDDDNLGFWRQNTEEEFVAVREGYQTNMLVWWHEFGHYIWKLEDMDPAFAAKWSFACAKVHYPSGQWAKWDKQLTDEK